MDPRLVYVIGAALLAVAVVRGHLALERIERAGGDDTPPVVWAARAAVGFMVLVVAACSAFAAAHCAMFPEAF